jgi:hypothetical protein
MLVLVRQEIQSEVLLFNLVTDGGNGQTKNLDIHDNNALVKWWLC